MPDLSPRSGLESLPATNPHAGEAGVRIALRSNLALASVIARKGQDDALAARVREHFALDLPRKPARAEGQGIAFVCTGPGQWLAIADGADGHAFEKSLRDRLGATASVSDQSDGRLVIRVSGPSARAAIQKGVLIDLHPRAFAPGAAAVTTIAHLGAALWQIDDTPAYEFAVFRSFAKAFRHWLEEAGAEYGVDAAAS